MFRDAFRRSRCLVIIDGFYEWDPKVTPKQPYHIRRKDQAAFAVAGLWAARDKADGTQEVNYAMITIGPNRVMEPIHHRMPVILDERDYKTWLDPATDLETLKTLLSPCPDDVLEAYPVSRDVNRPANDSPDCLRPE
jgi:putative SOS response-associated peptidase YedK